MNAACASALRPNPSFELSLPLHYLNTPTLVPRKIFVLVMLVRHIFTSRVFHDMSGNKAAPGVIRIAKAQ